MYFELVILKCYETDVHLSSGPSMVLGGNRVELFSFLFSSLAKVITANVTDMGSCATAAAASHLCPGTCWGLIAYKINLLTYKSNAGLYPTYLSDLLHDYVPSRTLRSSSQSLLQLPRRIPSKSYGQRSFFHAALHSGTTYHSKSVLPIMWTFLNLC